MKFLKLWDLSGYSERIMSNPNPSNFLGGGEGGSTPKKFRRVCMEFSKHNWATISETIRPEMLIFGK